VNEHRIAVVTQSLTSVPSRRHVLRGLAGAVLGLSVARLPEMARAKMRKKGLCRQDGSPCKKPGTQCKKRYCLSAPFTIVAAWTEERDHDTYVFVPPQNAATGPAPYLDFLCNPEPTTCEEAYPFACVDGDEFESGDEVTTIHRLLSGRYEYWLDLYDPSPAGAATVTIKAGNGRIVRQWTSPDTTEFDSSAWHVFDVDGRHGRVADIDELAEGPMPDAAHDPFTTVCPLE
jgi:hypothetical protein